MEMFGLLLVSVQAAIEWLLSKVFCPSKACGTQPQRSMIILQKQRFTFIGILLDHLV